MSEEEVYITVKSFQPITINALCLALNLSRLAVRSAIYRLRMKKRNIKAMEGSRNGIEKYWITTGGKR